MDIIHSGVLSLPGSRDRNGRALIVVTTENTIWESPKCTSTQLARILMYYYAISKKEVQMAGFRLLIDARASQPAAALGGALHIFQKTVPGGIHSVLVLAAKESSGNVEVLTGVQTETLPSIRALHKYVEPAQLTQIFAGSFLYSNEKWVRYRLRLESLLYACRASLHFLRSTSDQLEAKQLPETAKEIPVLIEEDQMLMRQVLQDARLSGLQQEGAAILVKLKRESVVVCGSEDYTPDLEVTCALYEQVDEELHRLVQVSNRRQRDLEKLACFWRFEEQYRQVNEWLRDVGRPQLDRWERAGGSRLTLCQRQRNFQALNRAAMEYCQQGQALLRDMVHWEVGISPRLQPFANQLQDCRSELADFTRRAEECQLAIDREVRRHMADENWMSDRPRPPAGSSGTPHQLPGPREEVRGDPEAEEPQMGEADCRRYLEQRGLAAEGWPVRTRTPEGGRGSAAFPPPPPAAHCCSSPDVRQCGPRPWGTPPPPPPPAARHPLKKTRSFDLAQQLSPPPSVGAAGGGAAAFSHRALSEPGDTPSSRGGAGVLIRGLEVSSTELVDRTCSPKEHVMLGRPRAVQADSPWGGATQIPQPAKGSKPRCVLAAALVAEQEYVRCLEHVVGSYLPELEAPDVPQELRGKRAALFGNVEKLLVFHREQLLPEISACLGQPFSLGDCFLRYREHFAMYALYVKNKPRSDALLTCCADAFFKRKLLSLGNRTDLGSDLDKPIQRMTSYSLLLQELMGECSTDNTQERRSLRAAMEMVQFQLRHGNDLLAMDAIRECDVDLKEQGQLLRHARFTVSCGRRKAVRQVFLFEQLIVLSKPKRAEAGPDAYMYKLSLKTADVGLTENIGGSGLRFEVWVRRRRSNESYVFQAETVDVKQAWTRDIAQILWRQASRNKEMRLQEMLSMGMGSKLSLDQLSMADSVGWQSVDCAVTGKGKLPSE